jgi:hypothetical protein
VTFDFDIKHIKGKENKVANALEEKDACNANINNQHKHNLFYLF